MSTPACAKVSPRFVALATILLVLMMAPLRMDAAAPLHIRWNDLSTLVGKNVSIAMPGGAVITGDAAGVEPDALLVDVSSTSDAKTYPKGLVRVPRASLHRFDMRTKGKAYRVIGTVAGSAAGLVGGALAWWGVTGGIFSNKNQAAGAVAFCGIWAGGTVGGYFAGNAADKHWTPVEISE